MKSLIAGLLISMSVPSVAGVFGNSNMTNHELKASLIDFQAKGFSDNETYSLTVLKCKSTCTFKAPAHGIFSSPESRDMITHYEFPEVKVQLLSPQEAYESLVELCSNVVENKIQKTGVGYQFDGYPRSKKFIDLITEPTLDDKNAEDACEPVELNKLSRNELIQEILFMKH